MKHRYNIDMVRWSHYDESCVKGLNWKWNIKLFEGRGRGSLQKKRRLNWIQKSDIQGFVFLQSSSWFERNRLNISFRKEKPFTHHLVNKDVDMSFFFFTQDFTINSAFTPYWNLRYKTIQEHVVYSEIIMVLCLLCISDLYLTLPVCLDTKTSFKPQLPSAS